MNRCPWCESDPLYIKYHDNEWGTTVRDDRKLFEMLVLEGAQAGLSWLTILKKEHPMRKPFVSLIRQGSPVFRNQIFKNCSISPALSGMNGKSVLQ